MIMHKDMSAEERIKQLIAEQLHIDVVTVTNDATLSQLGADSLDVVELIIRFEDEFSLEIDDAAAEKLHTVGDVINYINSVAAPQ